MNEQFILYQKDQSGICTITLNRIDKMNAFNNHFIKELTKALLNADEDPSVRVVILNANGRCFCAGADLNWMQEIVHYSKEENTKDARQLLSLMHTLHFLSKPTIALIQGPTFGGGVGLVTCCDIAIASTKAEFCFSEVKWGIVPAVISPFVIQAIGPRMTRRYFLTAEMIDAETALNSNIVHQIVKPKALEETGLTIAKQILKNGPQALAAAKELISYVTHKPFNETLELETVERIANIRISNEGQEGLNAFIEKRKPNWVKK